ncbi:MAG: M3 family metallopeptidase [Gammaproteobacteria bacterium]|nr:M3 family metallopeptidase [Gammaproteobacteria bacterium]
MTSNPLLNFEELPRFSTIGAEHIEPAVSAVLADNRSRLRTIIDAPANKTDPDWQSLMAPLDDMEDSLSKAWSTVSHLNAVSNTPEIREAYNTCQPMITEYYTALGQNRALFEAVKALAGRADELHLGSSQRKILRDYLLEFRLAGVDLDEDRKKKFAELESRLSKLSNTFSNNVLDATMAWSKQVTDVSELSGIPEMTQRGAADIAGRRGLEGYVLTLDAPCYISVMTNADNRELRRELYEAYVTRASDQSKAGQNWDNKNVIDEILSCRSELAHLLGYESYAEVSVARKMAGSVGRVNEFLRGLADLAVPAARREYEELRQFAASEHGQSSLEAWDIPYFSEKLRKQSFDISQEELRQYFPIDQVQAGLFEIATRLYGVTIQKNAEMELWSDSVEAFDILKDGSVVARFYFDLFTREGKKSGAWMAECRSRRQLADSSVQIPVAYLICNFAQSAGGELSLLTHNEVTTLFHEFGHGLHHMLTSETHLRSSGINGVAWDAVELPSQLMENWCWEPDAIAMISRHYKTGDSLPTELLNKLLAARNFQAGMKTVRQLEFALFDFQLHQLSGPMGDNVVLRVMQQVRALTSVYETPGFNRFQNSFSHIFAGGYAAGYYSYKWAEVLSADVFSRFAEHGVFNPDTGSRFLEQVLSRGGGADPLELFTAFMGREPKIESLLRQDGLLA